MNAAYAEVTELKAWCPTGEPTLFNTYVHDFKVSKPCKIAMFFDDIAINANDNNKNYAYYKLRCITAAESLYTRWRMKINAVKTKALCYVLSMC